MDENIKIEFDLDSEILDVKIEDVKIEEKDFFDYSTEDSCSHYGPDCLTEVS